jgi:hypothetical protein
MRIDSVGNIGIGESSPQQKLSVSSITNNDGVRITNTNTASTTAKTTRVLFCGTDTFGTVKEAGNIYMIPEGVNYVDSAMAFFTRATDVVVERMRIVSTGNVGIGTSTPSSSALLDVSSTTKGVRMPNMTTVQKNAIGSPVAGLMVFDTTLSKLCVYSGTAWETITSI